jgi:CBS domain-containing protein
MIKCKDFRIMRNGNQLEDKKIGNIRNLIVKDPTVISEGAEMIDVLRKMNEDLRTRHIYVVDGDKRLVGSVRMNSIVQYLFPYSSVLTIGVQLQSDLGSNLFSKHVEDIMRRDPFYVKEGDTLGDCAKIFISEKMNELPVVKDDMTIVGQINIHEIIEDYISSSEND